MYLNIYFGSYNVPSSAHRVTHQVKMFGENDDNNSAFSPIELQFPIKILASPLAISRQQMKVRHEFLMMMNAGAAAAAAYRVSLPQGVLSPRGFCLSSQGVSISDQNRLFLRLEAGFQFTYLWWWWKSDIFTGLTFYYCHHAVRHSGQSLPLSIPLVRSLWACKNLLFCTWVVRNLLCYFLTPICILCMHPRLKVWDQNVHCLAAKVKKK